MTGFVPVAFSTSDVLKINVYIAQIVENYLCSQTKTACFF